MKRIVIVISVVLAVVVVAGMLAARQAGWVTSSFAPTADTIRVGHPFRDVRTLIGSEETDQYTTEGGTTASSRSAVAVIRSDSSGANLTWESSSVVKGTPVVESMTMTSSDLQPVRFDYRFGDRTATWTYRGDSVIGEEVRDGKRQQLRYRAPGAFDAAQIGLVVRLLPLTLGFRTLILTCDARGQFVTEISVDSLVQIVGDSPRIAWRVAERSGNSLLTRWIDTLTRRELQSMRRVGGGRESWSVRR